MKRARARRSTRGGLQLYQGLDLGAVGPAWSPATRRAYRAAWERYTAWAREAGRGLDSRSLALWRGELVAAGLAPASVSLQLCGVRAVARAAVAAGLAPPALAREVADVAGLRSSGARGRWLSLAQAQVLVSAARASHAPQDTTIMALLLGCALRLQEALTAPAMELRDGRACLVDVHGKGSVLRTVAVPEWAAEILGDREAPYLRLSRSGVRSRLRALWLRVPGDVRGGIPRVAPHDLRRTAAQLALVGGAALEQIQLWLGHQSLLTTQRYLGVIQNLRDAPGDHTGLA